MSTGAVLLADILPTLIIKLTFPFFMQRIPFGARHLVVVLLQTASYFVVAYSTSVTMSLAGVAIASFGAGLGEITYLGLASHFNKNSISAWSSGTGGAGIIGALAYAGLTEPHFADLSPKTTLLIMLVVPVIFAFAYWVLLVVPDSVHTPDLRRPSTWVVPASNAVPYTCKAFDYDSQSSPKRPEIAPYFEKEEPEHIPAAKLTFKEKILLVLPLIKYMIPLALVYVGEYFINQGLTALIFFDCSHGFHLARSAQYRWYQVIYQLGVFISRSSVNLIQLPLWALVLLPVLQLLNAGFFLAEAVFWFVPHIGIVFALILFEGFFGGASYVNTFNTIHKKVRPEQGQLNEKLGRIFSSKAFVRGSANAVPSLKNLAVGQLQLGAATRVSRERKCNVPASPWIPRLLDRGEIPARQCSALSD
uniref:Battenin n=1 Tax=Steinernema glaseri TaxID=37863 RepID=A0A1I8ASK6_9BILA